jgi:hypothetical protein
VPSERRVLVAKFSWRLLPDYIIKSTDLLGIVKLKFVWTRSLGTVIESTQMIHQIKTSNLQVWGICVIKGALCPHGGGQALPQEKT